MRSSQTREAVSPKLRVVLPLWKKVIFAALPSIALVILVLVVWMFLCPEYEAAALPLRTYAWERTYIERHVPVPAAGPREGDIRMSRILKKADHPLTHWCESRIDLPGVLEIDAEGRQHYRPGRDAMFNVLIIGSSVASGSYATTTAATYFGRVGAMLESEQTPTKITVFAAAGWKSVQEADGLGYCIQSGLSPNLVVIISGLNDLNNAASADALMDPLPPATMFGRRFRRAHTHDYERRVGLFLRNMQSAAKYLREQNIPVLFVLQPALFERDPLTDIERRLLADALARHKSKEALVESYAKMRSELTSLADEENVFFLDCSRIFNGESATTFVDIWHFSDFGHQILADALTPRIKYILQRSAKKKYGDTP